MIMVAAVVLGLLAFAADAVDGFAARQGVTALVSSGIAWGLAASLAGRAFPDRRGAATGATALLVSATLVYYLLILVVSRRWSGGSPVDGLRSLAVMTAAWLLVSVVAGPSLGLLGRTTRAAPTAGAALAAGVACGLLSGQGRQEIVLTPPGLPWAIRGPEVVVDHGIGTAPLIEIVVPLAVLVWMATGRRLWPAWPVLVTSTVATAALSALSWWFLLTAATHLG
jgi:hypothetical protein